jgi:hypothetical protein
MMFAMGLLLTLSQQRQQERVSGQWSLTFKTVFPIPETTASSMLRRSQQPAYGLSDR